jgi:hypothetical protein
MTKKLPWSGLLQRLSGVAVRPGYFLFAFAIPLAPAILVINGCAGLQRYEQG